MRETILVVGGAGYIGSHMVKELIAKDYNVLILDNLSTGYRRLVTGGQLIEGDLGDSRLLDRIFAENHISAVMHFAAFSLVGESVQQPLKYYRNNVAQTIALIESMIRHGVMRFVFSSTAAVYGEPDNTPIAETHRRMPTNPYGTSKLCVEQMLSDCDTAFGLKSICLRYFNAAGADAFGRIGEMHNPETHLIPLVLDAALSNNPIKIFGTDYKTPDGTCLRDYVHVSDLAQAHLLALDSLMDDAQSDVFNLGNSVGYSVRQVVDIAAQVTGMRIDVQEDERRPGDPAILVADASKIRSQLNWQPKYEQLDTIIQSAWNWHRKNKS